MNMPRCFGRLFVEGAKECCICHSKEECFKLCPHDSVPGKSHIRDMIIAALKESPRTVEELSVIISNSSSENHGTSVFYHLSFLKRQGRLRIVFHGGKRKYSLFR